MSVGFFIALLDIQIVAASLRDIGGGLSAGTDETAWVQTRVTWIAEIIASFRCPNMAVAGAVPRAGCSASRRQGVHLDEPACAAGRGMIPQHDRVQGAARVPGRIDDPDGVHHGVRLFPGPSTGDRRRHHRRPVLARADPRPHGLAAWITDHYSWHWLFFINLIPGAVVTVVVPLLVRIDTPDLKALRGADYLGMALMALALGCLEYTLEEGPRWGWMDDATISTTGLDRRDRRPSRSSCAACCIRDPWWTCGRSRA